MGVGKSSVLVKEKLMATLFVAWHFSNENAKRFPAA